MTGTADRRGPEDGDWSTGQHPHAYGQQQQPYEGQYAPYEQQGYVPYEQQQPYEPYQQPYEQQPYEQPYVPYQQQPYQEQYTPYEQQQYVQQPYDPYAQPPQAYQAPAEAPPEPPRVAPVLPPRPRAATPPPAAPPAPAEPSEQVGGRRTVPKPARGGDQDPYQTGEFTFVDEEAEETEDVIDWLKFAESRSERRDERRRKLRNRAIGAAVALALVAGGGAGYVWLTGGFGNSQSAAAAAGPRSVIVVHLRDLQGKVSTALLVNDASGHKGSTLLLPETLLLPASADTAATPLGQAMDSLGPAATRDGLAGLLGAPVAGTWRLDTPYLRLLVAQLGGVKVDTNAQVAGPDGKPLVEKGQQRTLTGDAAVAYATYQAPGENRSAQLARFGQVLEALIRTMPTALADATDDVHRMNAVLDPSLPEKALAGLLAELAQQAKDGHFSTGTLTVKPDGTLDEATAGAQVKDVLGGTVHAAAAVKATARVGIQDATGNDQSAAAAQIQVVNSGLTFVSTAKASSTQATTEIRYTDDARAEAANSLAASFGLQPSAVKKVTDAQTVDILVVLGKDYQAAKQ